MGRVRPLSIPGTHLVYTINMYAFFQYSSGLRFESFKNMKCKGVWTLWLFSFLQQLAKDVNFSPRFLTVSESFYISFRHPSLYKMFLLWKPFWDSSNYAKVSWKTPMMKSFHYFELFWKRCLCTKFFFLLARVAWKFRFHLYLTKTERYKLM